ncbi:hypothetical protein ACVJ5M_005746 [Bradyrhizobium sp. S3.7.6]
MRRLNVGLLLGIALSIAVWSLTIWGIAHIIDALVH